MHIFTSPLFLRRMTQSRLLSVVLLLIACTLGGCLDNPVTLVAEQNEQTQDDSVENISTVAAAGSVSQSDVTQTEEDVLETGSAYTAPVLESAAASAAITEVVLVTGQSNALGAETGFDASLDIPHTRAFAFTESGWQVADLNQVWDLGWHPRNNPETDPSNNFGFHFARTVALRRPDRVIGFILVTEPGAAISQWDYESELYMKIRSKVTTALNELPSKATIDGILWHQGETDWADNDYYTSKLNGLIQNFRGESWFGDSRPFICGETVASPVNNRLMALNTDNDAWTGCVSSDGLPTFLDGLHFSAEGLRIIGTRYATKYIQMTEQP